MNGGRTGLGRWSCGIAAPALLLVQAACGTGTAALPIEAEMSGTWLLAAVCTYDTDEGEPCRASGVARTLSFDTESREVSSSDRARQGRYRLDVQPTADGGDVVYIDLPGDAGPAAQIWLAADTLVLSWAYVDGAEERYLRAAGVEGGQP